MTTFGANDAFPRSLSQREVEILQFLLSVDDDRRDMAPVVAARIRRAMEAIPAQRLILSTDCGFGCQGFSRTIAFCKATAIAQARTIVFKEVGMSERSVLAADPALQVVVLPDREPLTHPSPAWT